MKAMHVNITDREWEWLNAECVRLGISRSDLIRRILDQRIAEHAAENGVPENVFQK
jgi:metal-responsive CopG/Arc/MetJ family transcriptional regulator